MNLGIFVGTYMDQKLDSKGRLSVPAKWRERLGTEFFMVCMNLRGSTCIKLYPQDEFMHCVEALDDGTANEVYEKNKIFFSNAEECTLDAQGRFTLNARLKDYAGMENGSTVICKVTSAPLRSGPMRASIPCSTACGRIPTSWI